MKKFTLFFSSLYLTTVLLSASRKGIFEERSIDKEQINIIDDVLSNVGEFRGIVARGNPRTVMSAQSHRDLVKKKYDKGSMMPDHITLFRVKDKKDLPPKEQKGHTVPGPVWTPPSSVGFVMGAQSKGLRIWSATEATDDKNGLLGDNGKPSILARELMATVAEGWMARTPENHEKYGNTARQPHIVFTPPLSPRYIGRERVKNVMNVKTSWSDLTISSDELARLAAPIPKKQTDFLKKFRLSREDTDDYRDMLSARTTGSYNEDVDINRMMEIHSDNPDLFHALTQEDFGDYDILCAFTTDNALSFFREYGEEIDISRMVEIYHNNLELFYALTQEDFGDYDILCAFTTDNALSFFREYGEEIDISRMVEIYHNNLELFYALINDTDNLLQDINIENFIMKYQHAQATVTAIPEDDPYYGEHNAYDLLRGWIFTDTCPDELLPDDNSVDAEARDTSDCEDLESSNTNEGAAAEGVMYLVGSVEYTQEVLLGCRHQLERDKLLRTKLGDGFLKDLELISNTFPSDIRNTTVFASTQQKVDEIVAFLRKSLQDYVHIKWMRAFPESFMSQQRDMEEAIVQYESLLHSLHTIDNVNCILGDVGAHYYDVR